MVSQTDLLFRLDFSVKDWVIVFNVALDRVNILPGEEGYEEARAAIQQPGDYSIESLFLTFNGKNGPL